MTGVKQFPVPNFRERLQDITDNYPGIKILDTIREIFATLLLNRFMALRDGRMHSN